MQSLPSFYANANLFRSPSSRLDLVREDMKSVAGTIKDDNKDGCVDDDPDDEDIARGQDPWNPTIHDYEVRALSRIDRRACQRCANDSLLPAARPFREGEACIYHVF